jgi:hypothetical protein
MLNSFPLIKIRAVFVLFLMCWMNKLDIGVARDLSKPKPVRIPTADYISRAKGIIRALYPGLDPTGAATPDSWTGNSIQYADAGDWIGLGSSIVYSADPPVYAANPFTTAGGYKGSGNSSPECAPLPVSALDPTGHTIYPKSWIAESFTDLLTFTQQACPFCDQYIFNSLVPSTLPIVQSEAGFRSFLGQGYQYCDGTQSFLKGNNFTDTLGKGSVYLTGPIKDYFKAQDADPLNPGVTAITVSRRLHHNVGIYTFFFPPAISDSQSDDVALLYHEGLHSFGDWPDGNGFPNSGLCALVDQPQPEPTGINSDACAADHSVFNLWLLDHVIPTYPLFTGP